MRFSASDRARGRQRSRGREPPAPSALWLCVDECCVLAHVVVAGLDPDRVVDDPVHDRVGVDAGAGSHHTHDVILRARRLR